MKEFFVTTTKHQQMVDITLDLQNEIPSDFSGSMHIYTPHTSAGITINEGADPAVQHDIMQYLNDAIPWDNPLFTHAEGNSAAHIKAMIVGNSVQIIIKSGKIQLGVWEKIFYCEFDGPRKRTVWMQFLHS